MIAWGRGDERSYPFQIAGRSGTSGSWTTIFSGTSSGNTTNFEDYNVNDISARQIRIRGANDGSYTNITEVQVIGTGGPSGSPNPPPTSSNDFDIRVSSSANRSNANDLSGETLSGNAFVFVDPASQIDQVLFYIDNTSLSGSPDRTENFAPFDLRGGSQLAQPYNTEQLSNGSHTISVRVLFNDGTVQTGTSTFNVSNGTSSPPPPTSSNVSIVNATSSNRSNTSNLNGSTVDGDIYVLVIPADEVDQVMFFIDNSFVKTENVAPFDLQGGPGSGANPYDTTDLSNGNHTLRADILFNNGSTDSITANFSVDNSGGGSNPPSGGGQFGLDPNAEPWENFDLSDWALDSPEGRSSNECQSRRIDEDEWDEVPGTDTADYFFTHTDGGMRFVSPVGGATTNSSCNSGFPRSELREMLRAGNTSVSTTGANANNWALGYQPGSNTNHGGRNGVLTATLRVNRVTTTGTSSLHPGRTIIGQIHASGDEPLRLYYRKRPGADHGCIYAEHEINDGEDVTFNIIGNEQCTGNGPSNGIELDELFSYEIINDDEDIIVRIRRGDSDGPLIGNSVNIDMNQLNSNYDEQNEWMYFKAGAYTQNNTGNDSDTDIITFYRLENSHDNN